MLHGTLIPETEVDDFIVLRARAFTSKVRRAMIRDILAIEGLTLQEWQVLFSVARHGPCHMAFITEHTLVDAAHGSRATMTLENKGLVARKDDPDNRRRKLISLTPVGIETVQRIWPRASGLVKDATNALSRSELDVLKGLLDRLNAALGAGAAQPETMDPKKDIKTPADA